VTPSDWELTCTEALRSLQEYLDGELPQVAAVELEEHLRRCPGCPKKLEVERAFRAILRRQRNRYAPPRPALRDRILAALRGLPRGFPDSMQESEQGRRCH